MTQQLQVPRALGCTMLITFLLFVMVKFPTMVLSDPKDTIVVDSLIPVCTLTGGKTVSVGWSGNDTGINWCSTCDCNEDDGLVCIEKACEEQPGCTLTGGKTVPVGWSGSGTGSNSCNACNCNKYGLICTLRLCPEYVGCTLPGGKTVSVGWSGNDTGINWCNTCDCEKYGLACSKMTCEEQPEIDSSICCLGEGACDNLDESELIGSVCRQGQTCCMSSDIIAAGEFTCCQGGDSCKCSRDDDDPTAGSSGLGADGVFNLVLSTCLLIVVVTFSFF